MLKRPKVAIILWNLNHDFQWWMKKMSVSEFFEWLKFLEIVLNRYGRQKVDPSKFLKKSQKVAQKLWGVLQKSEGGKFHEIPY